MMILLVILVLGGYALYTMNADERTQLKERIVTATERARKDAERRRAEPEPFRDALRERSFAAVRELRAAARARLRAGGDEPGGVD